MTAANAYFSTFWSAPDNRPFLTVISGDQRECIRWGDFRTMCLTVADELRRRGVGVGDIVLIFYPHQRWLLPTFFAAQLIGALPSFMPPLSPRQDRALFKASHVKVVSDLQPAMICADAPTAATLDLPVTRTLLLEDLDMLPASEPAEARARANFACDGTAALLQHSSGTTGLKKGVVLSYDAVMAQLESYGRAIELNGEETIVTWLPVYHDMGLIAATLLPFVTGTPVVAMGAFDWLVKPWRLLEEMASVSRPLAWLPNFAFASIARTAARLPSTIRLDGVRAFINCSEPCKPAVIDRFVEVLADRGITSNHIQTCYAMAENTFAVSQSRLGVPAARWSPPHAGDEAFRLRDLLSCGRCIDGVDLEVRNAAGNRVPDGEIGELHVSGSSLFGGYHGQPQLTASKLRNGWYATGDLGALHNGEVFIAGRRDDLIIIAGRSLYAHELEEEVSGVEGVKPGRVCAFGIANEESGTDDLVVLVETTSEAPPAALLQRVIRERLAGTVLVSSAKVVTLPLDTLVKTTSGKISRKENRTRFELNSLTTWGGNA